jgi:hypothetical protein
MRFQEPSGKRPLRPGDIVEVRPADEILATLDKNGALSGTVFMPEMIAHLGKRFTVTRRVDKICNMVDETGSRRMFDTVYLDDLRCNGSGHGGCQAGCRIYWKEEWLRRVEDGAPVSSTGSDDDNNLTQLVEAATRLISGEDGKQSELWRCQATDALKASEPLKRSNLGQYWREFTNGNFNPLRYIRLLARAFVMETAFQFGLVKTLPLHGPGSHTRSSKPLNLQPGELVKVRTPEEIAATLDQRGENRGLSFDREMLVYCGQTLRVKEGVRRIIDEKNGRMLKIPRDCIILDGVCCSGELSVCGRWFCPRGIYPFWREDWVQRVEEAESS